MTFHYKSLYSNNRWSGFSHFYYAIARSLGKKISLQYQNDDVIDFGDLDINDDKSEETEKAESPKSSSLSNGVSNTTPRRESRGISEVSADCAPALSLASSALQNLLTTSYNFSVQRCNFLVKEPVLIKY